MTLICVNSNSTLYSVVTILNVYNCQSETAMVVDSVSVLWKIFDEMLQRDPKVFQHAFRRGTVYNYNKTRGIPCTTKPPVPWMFGETIMSAIKAVSTNTITMMCRSSFL